MRYILLAVATLVCACSGGAAKNSAAALGVIERSHLEDSFEDASNGDRAAIRHRPSGLVCDLPEEGAFHVELFPDSAVNEGAACTHAAEGVVETLMALRFSRPVTFERAFTEAVTMSAPLQNARRWRGAPIGGQPIGVSERVERIQGDLNGQQYFVRIAMKEVRDGWLLQQIVLSPLELADQVDSASDERWRALIADRAE